MQGRKIRKRSRIIHMMNVSNARNCFISKFIQLFIKESPVAAVNTMHSIVLIFSLVVFSMVLIFFVVMVIIIWVLFFMMMMMFMLRLVMSIVLMFIWSVLVSAAPNCYFNLQK